MNRVGRQGEVRRARLARSPWRVALALGTLLTLAACGGEDIHVERAAALPSDAEVAPFVVLRAKAQSGAKDFDKYADHIAGDLAAKGFTRVDQPAQARYAVMFSYDGDGAGWIYEEGSLSRKDSKRDENSVDRTVSIILFDLTRPKRTDEQVFAGRAQCLVETTTHDSVLVTALFDAVLRDFPGSRREIYTVGLPKF